MIYSHLVGLNDGTSRYVGECEHGNMEPILYPDSKLWAVTLECGCRYECLDFSKLTRSMAIGAAMIIGTGTGSRAVAPEHKP